MSWSSFSRRRQLRANETPYSDSVVHSTTYPLRGYIYVVGSHEVDSKEVSEGGPTRSEQDGTSVESPLRDNIPSPSRENNNERDRHQGRDSPVYVSANSDEEYEDLIRHFNDPSDTQVCTALDHSTSSSLMTVEALAVDHQTNTSTSVLDTGAQRSSISQDAVTRLNIKVSNATPPTTVTFGATRTAEPSGMLDVGVVDKQSRNIRLTLRTKGHLTAPYSSVNFTAKDRQFLQSHNIRLEYLAISRHPYWNRLLLGHRYIGLSSDPSIKSSPLQYTIRSDHLRIQSFSWPTRINFPPIPPPYHPTKPIPSLVSTV
uniref:Peptidase A2 domain-containing protein n=1 Tax=Haemonchus contortus TaxID=6289 RepID=A0A7I4Z251_HAECO